MEDKIGLAPIGHVRGGRTEAIDDDWGGTISSIHLDPETFTEDALAGLGDFSHIDVIFFFDKVPETKIEFGARHPRGREDWPQVGIFAQRGKNRPNRFKRTVADRTAPCCGLGKQTEGGAVKG